MEETKVMEQVQIPEGHFCRTGNCTSPTECRYWDWSRGYCGYYKKTVDPNDRNGCLSKIT